MPALPRRERIVQELVARLKRINGSPNYNWDLEGRVERYFHKWKGDEHLFNAIETTPAAIVFDGDESGAFGGEGSQSTWVQRFELVTVIYLRRGLALDDLMIRSEDVGKLLADFKRMLLRDAQDAVNTSLDVYVSQVELQTSRLEPDEDEATDGLVARLFVTYEENFGDPTT